MFKIFKKSNVEATIQTPVLPTQSAGKSIALKARICTSSAAVSEALAILEDVEFTKKTCINGVYKTSLYNANKQLKGFIINPDRFATLITV